MMMPYGEKVRPNPELFDIDIHLYSQGFNQRRIQVRLGDCQSCGVEKVACNLDLDGPILNSSP